MNTPLETLLGPLLTRRGLRLAVAESCTGGLIGHRITNVPGSSEYYLGSVIAYAYEAKARLLGVRWETLNTYGAVSREAVLEMASGVRAALGTEIGLSVSGIAGPGGGTPEKPVGTTWIGLSAARLNAADHELTESESQAWHFVWSGDRLQNKEQSAEMALRLLVEYLNRNI